MPSYDLSYTYDSVGNRLTKTDNATGQTTSYTYLCKGQAGSCFEFTGYGFCLPLGLAG